MSDLAQDFNPDTSMTPDGLQTQIDELRELVKLLVWEMSTHIHHLHNEHYTQTAIVPKLPRDEDAS